MLQRGVMHGTAGGDRLRTLWEIAKCFSTEGSRQTSTLVETVGDSRRANLVELQSGTNLTIPEKVEMIVNEK